MRKYKRVFLAICLSLGFLSTVKAQPAIDNKALTKPLVVTSIKPLEYIVADLAGEFIELRSVLSASGSPHHYSLTSSQVRMINTSELLIWVDPGFEYFLAKLAARRKAESIFQLAPLIQATTQKSVLGGVLSNYPASYEGNYLAASKTVSHRPHSHADKDLHVWLNPENVARIVKPLTQMLRELIPQHEDALRKNEKNFLESLSQFSTDLKSKLDYDKQNNFIVFHDAYRHFESAFGFKPLASVTSVPDEQVGARTLARIKRHATQSHCLIADVSEYAAAQKMASNLGIRLITVDLLASQPVVPAFEGRGRFISYMERFALQFSECFLG